MNHKGVVVDHLDAIRVISPWRPNARLGIHSRIPSEGHIIRSNGFAILPIDVVSQLPGDVHGPRIFVNHNSAILLSWQFRRELGICITLGI